MEKKTTCLFCGSADVKESFYPKVKFNNRVFIYQECRNCKLNFNDPLLEGDDYAALYPIEYHDEFYFRVKKKYAEQLSILKKYSGIRSVVDYGCGDAGLLSVLSANGFECTGVEYSSSLVSRLKQQYPAINFYTVEEFVNLEKKYDCIHLGDVLEHMTEPNKTIQNLRDKLSGNGYLFVEGPIEHNTSLAYAFRKLFFRVRKKFRPHRQVEGRPYHTFLANRKNQRAMLEKNLFATRYFKIYETGWPFPEKLKDCKSIKLTVEYIIALVSIFGSWFFPSVGNRFYFMGQLQPVGK
jgi:2-polyprenyl-3-methyl-5-hydroxy-6-metoxy-1,4-benzoquinol methylase